jgi:hypothetical protein
MNYLCIGLWDGIVLAGWHCPGGGGIAPAGVALPRRGWHRPGGGGIALAGMDIGFFGTLDAPWAPWSGRCDTLGSGVLF